MTKPSKAKWVSRKYANIVYEKHEVRDRDEHGLIVTDFLYDLQSEHVKNQIIDILDKGAGRLEVREGTTTLYFFNLNDRKNFQTTINAMIDTK